jgi:hypothetical protein
VRQQEWTPKLDGSLAYGKTLVKTPESSENQAIIKDNYGKLTQYKVDLGPFLIII